MSEKQLIRYMPLADDYGEIARIFFVIDETGEEIEGYPQIQNWVNSIYKENKELKEENEQLKQQVGRIQYLIDNKIDEFKNGDYGDLPCNVIHMFLDLKKEIGDLE